MKPTESALREIKDRISMVMGVLEEAAPNPQRRLNYQQLNLAARELHACADDMQNIMMKVKPR
jgi:hypothetical protein